MLALSGCSGDSATMCNAGTNGVVVVTATPATAPVFVRTADEEGVRGAVIATAPGTFSIDDATGVVASRTRTFETGELVGTAYNGVVTPNGACVFPIAVDYAVDPASHRLWIAGSGSANLFGIPEASLHASATVAPDVTLGGLTNPSHPAFGPDGSLYLTDTNRVIAFRPATLAAGGSPDPDVVLTGADLQGVAIPGPSALAFDADGNLWVGNQAGQTVKRFAAADVTHSGEPTATISIESSDLSAVSAIALQSNGDVWIANSDGDIVEFTVSQFAAHVTAPAATRVRGYTPTPVVSELGSASWIVFDENDNLWVAYFAPNLLVRYTPAEQNNAAENTPAVQLRLPVDVLLESAAFDASGALWFTSAQHKVGSIAAANLTGVGDANVTTLLEVTGLGYAEGLAFDPAPDNVVLAF